MTYFKKVQCDIPLQVVVDSPVRITEVALLLDTVDNKTLGRVKFFNQSRNDIIAIIIRIDAFNIAHEKLVVEKERFIYQDIIVHPGEVYGNKVELPLPDDTRRISIRLDKVVYADSEVWDYNAAISCSPAEARIISIPHDYLYKVQEKISETILNIEFVSYYYTEGNGFWQCTCGKINHENNNECSFCLNSKHAQSKHLTEAGIDSIIRSIDKEIEEQKRIDEEQKRLKEERIREEERTRLAEEQTHLSEEQICHESEVEEGYNHQLEVGEEVSDDDDDEYDRWFEAGEEISDDEYDQWLDEELERLEKSDKKVLKWVLVGLSVILLLCVAVFYLKPIERENMKPTLSLNEPKSTPTPISTTTSTPTPKPTQKSNEKAVSSSTSKSTKYCEVDGCYNEGKYAYSILGLPDEYYCKTHYDDMMDIVEMMESDVGSGKYSKHSCEASGCNREGTNSIIGLAGTTEYYCTKHYNELNDILNYLLYS